MKPINNIPSGGISDIGSDIMLQNEMPLAAEGLREWPICGNRLGAGGT